MLEKFYQEVKQLDCWHPEERILLAVSGGVDSMILLYAMMKVSEMSGCTIGVAHLNHNLRPESKKESTYIEEFCTEHQLPFYLEVWQEEIPENNQEARYREFRYNFFRKLMAQYNYTTIMTAHHADDQAETILMKWVRGSRLVNLAGIKKVQAFGTGKLVRPFLIFSKEELKVFANEQNIVYFEDSSNQSEVYFRNRIRHRVIPYLKEENPNFLKHVETFSTQVSMADELINGIMEKKYKQWVSKNNFGWEVDLTELKKESSGMKYFFLQYLLQQTLIRQNIEMNQDQLEFILSSLDSSNPQQRIFLKKGWYFIKEYNIGYLTKETISSSFVTHILEKNQGLFLSENEWIGLESSETKLTVPEKVREWKPLERLLSSEVILPLKIRHREDGDRIALSETLTKRLNRIFIDKKVTNSFRENAWVVLTADEEVIWVPNFANSYLSIPKETDKIHYRLLYRTKE
ncbi:tRNA lysidine(34) synthetase TilS [Enterococcus sp. BWB1-3]|uniref:tRNA lysidine(34) synthetase TilS n=1 Tax=Enterococcus sp. BWB1-3 TaxID=2787713 RepID=UPI001922C3F6|nr:tRNA lysidine(34) synthetase TilS [Enterococcus sp. BWB1-3]